MLGTHLYLDQLIGTLLVLFFFIIAQMALILQMELRHHTVIQIKIILHILQPLNLMLYLLFSLLQSQSGVQVSTVKVLVLVLSVYQQVQAGLRLWLDLRFEVFEFLDLLGQHLKSHNIVAVHSFYLFELLSLPIVLRLPLLDRVYSNQRRLVFVVQKSLLGDFSGQGLHRPCSDFKNGKLFSFILSQELIECFILQVHISLDEF